MIGRGKLRGGATGVCCVLGFLLVLGHAAFTWAYPGEIPLEKQPPPPPPGTVITHANWEQYKDYMTLGQQLLWEGKMYWKFAPDLKWRVVAAKPWPIPPYYKADTAKYSGQVRLKKLPSGGTVLENYVAGCPFPQIREPDAGAKVLQNVYYRFTPFAHWAGIIWGTTVDRFGSVSERVNTPHSFRLSHLSDPELPHTVPGAGDADFADYVQLLEPETAKYTAQLNLFYQDQTKVEGLWSFIPSLRRVLRLSASARCSPSVAGDLYREDTHGGFIGGNYRLVVTRVTHKKMLVMTKCTPFNPTYPTPAELKAWGVNEYIPQPPDGEWEVRDAWVLEVMPTPEEEAGYCYKPKRIYVEGEEYAVIGTDNYDAGGKLWKISMFGFRPLPDGYGNFFTGGDPDGGFNWVDVQNQHSTQSFPSSLAAGGRAVPEAERNMQKYALPSGMAMIMQ